MITSIRYDLPQYQKALAEEKRISHQYANISAIYQHAVDSRKAAVDHVLKDVADRANRLYEKVHPGEGIAHSRLNVRQSTQGSLSLSTYFYHRECDPLLYYSESHLDTLGLCYFLAFRRYEATRDPNFKLLVLDDVMHSVDADHRSRIAHMLNEEFHDHQIVVTTHDPHFFDALRREFTSSGVRRYWINDWSIDQGPIFSEPLTDFDRIVDPETRRRQSPEVLSAAGGRFFEWLLKEVAEQLQVSAPVRIKRGHDIGNLWPAVASRLKKQGGYYSQNKDVVEQLDRCYWVRNACGAHHNPTPAPPTPREAREFAELLTKLHNSLFCYDCRHFAFRQNDSSWQCAGGHIRYTKKAND